MLHAIDVVQKHIHAICLTSCHSCDKCVSHAVQEDASHSFKTHCEGCDIEDKRAIQANYLIKLLRPKSTWGIWAHDFLDNIISQGFKF